MKTGPKPKNYPAALREKCVTALCEGYSINAVSRAANIGETQIIRWRNEEGIEPILSTNSMRRKLPELVFEL